MTEAGLGGANGAGGAGGSGVTWTGATAASGVSATSTAGGSSVIGSETGAGATGAGVTTVGRLAKLNGWLAGAALVWASLSIPVATTETRILPFRSSLNAEPQMMFASGSTSSRIWFAASSTSI